jgi:hypothetical protein
MSIPDQLKIKKLHEELQQVRDNGVDRTLREHLQLNYSDFSREPNLSLEKYFHEYGIQNPTKMTVKQFLTLDSNKDLIWLFSEMILSMVTEGYRETFNVNELLAMSVDTAQTTVTLPVIDTRPMKRVIDKDRGVTMGVQFQTDSVTVGDKRINIDKFGVKLDLPYEVVDDTPFDILAIYLKQRGVCLALDKIRYLIDVMVSGDGGQDRKSVKVEDTIAEIGVKDTEEGITYRDILRTAVRMSLKGFPAVNMIGEEEQVVDVSMLEEYYQRYQGTPNSQLEMKGGIITPNKIYPVVDGIGEKRLVLQSPQYCTGEFKKQGLLIETDKLISRQLHEVVISTRSAMMNFFRAARVLIDGTKAFSGNGFPTFMQTSLPQ